MPNEQAAPVSAVRPNEIRAWRIDTIRQTIDGLFQPLVDSIFMVVAIGFFSVGDFWKGLIAASNFVGYLLSAPLTGFLNRSGIRRSRIVAVLTALSAFSLAAAAFADSGVLFAVCAAFSSAAVFQRQPFFSDLYGEVYPEERRAGRISLGLRLSILASLAAGLLCGRILEENLDSWRWIVGTAALALAAASILLTKLPEMNPEPREERWWQVLALPFRNPLFLYVQASWMLIGFGNLWTLPLRAVYLVERERGLGLSPVPAMLAAVLVPMAVRFLCNPLWAILYRKMSFPVLRVIINFFFIIAIPLYFLTESLPVIFTAAAFYGIASSGSPFIWQLWVTRIVSADQVRIYQSAHAFLAGLRGVAAPFIGFAVLGGLSFKTMGFLSAALGAAASIMMIPLMRKDRRF